MRGGRVEVEVEEEGSDTQKGKRERNKGWWDKESGEAVCGVVSEESQMTMKIRKTVV